jgi:hypothetical protein
MERTASKAKMTQGIKLGYSAKSNPDLVPKSNRKLNKGAVVDTFFGNSRACDTDSVGQSSKASVSRKE